MAYRDIILADQPTAFYEFNELTGTVANDSTGTYAGTYVNNPVLGVSGPWRGARAVEFSEGLDQYVTLGTVPLPVATAFSGECWFNSRTNTNGMLMAQGVASGGPYPLWLFEYDQSVTEHTLSFGLQDSTGATLAYLYTISTIADGNWHHLAFTYDNSTGGNLAALYIDGVQVATTTSGATASGLSMNTTYIGGWDVAGDTVDGTLAEVALYSYALTADQIAKHYSASNIPVGGAFTQGILAHTSALTDPSPDLVNYLISVGGMFDLVYGIVADQGFAGDPDYLPGWSTLLDPDACPTQFLPFLAQFNGTYVPPGTPDQQARQIIKLESGMQRGTVASIQSAALRYLVGTSVLVGTLQELAEVDLPIPTDTVTTSIPVRPLSQQVAPQTITLIDPTSAHEQQFLVLTTSYVGANSLSVYPTTADYPFPAGTTVWGPFLYIRERWNGTLSTADPYHLTLGFKPSEAVNVPGLQAAVNAVKPAGIIIDYVESDAWTWNEATGTWTADTMTWDQSATTAP